MNACAHGVEGGRVRPPKPVMTSFLPCDECEEALFEHVTAPVLALASSEAMKDDLKEAFCDHALHFGALVGVGDVLTNAHDIATGSDHDGELLELFTQGPEHVPALPDLPTVEAMLEAFNTAAGGW